MSGRLITLEGGEGAGKSTQAAVVQAWLECQGRRVLRSREPGGTPLAEAVRGVVLADWAEGMPLASEVLLIYAARAAHWCNHLLPALETGVDVVCDRFHDSSHAYQGAKGADDALLARLDQLCLGGRRPDLTLLLDLPPETGLARARARGGANRFEAAELAMQHQIRQRFLKRAGAEPARFVCIDATRRLAEVSRAVEQALEARL